MPNTLISQKEVDIYERPDVQEASQGGAITIGDLHGNAIKLLFILTKHRIITNIKPEEYKALVNIYLASFTSALFLNSSHEYLNF